MQLLQQELQQLIALQGQLSTNLNQPGYGVSSPCDTVACEGVSASPTSGAAPLSASPTSGTAPLDVQFGFNTAAYPSVSDWSQVAVDFGDGSVGAASSFQYATDCTGSTAYCDSIPKVLANHTYAAAGTYTAVLYVPPSIPTTCPASSAPCGTHLGAATVTVSSGVGVGCGDCSKPSNSCTLTATPASITAGQSAVLSWTSTLAGSATLSYLYSTQPPQVANNLPVPGSSGAVFSNPGTYNYRLVVTGADGSTVQCTATETVVSAQ